MERFERHEVAGEGTFGVVFAATELASGRKVALKKIRQGKYTDGVHVTTLREIKILQELRHPNIVGLVDVFAYKGSVVLAMEFVPFDLEQLVHDAGAQLTAGHVKSLLKMTLEGLAHCHSHWVLHRDLKPNNLLMGDDGVVKLADFGLARLYGSPRRNMSHNVVTLWYRAPELLFGAREYGAGVDMWAVGCIFAELLRRRPLFPGSSEVDTLGRIMQAFGSVTEERWPGAQALPYFLPFEAAEPLPPAQLFQGVPQDALDLLLAMLRYDPAQRVSAEDALRSAYFANDPPPTPPEQLPRPSPQARVALSDRGGGAAAAASRPAGASAEGATRGAARRKIGLDS